MTSNIESSAQSLALQVSAHTEAAPLQFMPVPAVVRIIEIPDKSGYTIQRGSGFFFDNNGHIAADAHEVEDKDGNILPRIAIATERGDYYSTHVEKLDDINDIAILKVDAGTPKYIKPFRLASANTHLRRNEPVLVWGYPGGAYYAYIAPGRNLGHEPLAGIFTGSKDRDACLAHGVKDYSSRAHLSERVDGFAELHRKLMVASMLVEGGLSGGPAINKYGDVIGIQDLASSPPPLAYFTPVNDLMTLMSNAYPKFAFTYKRDPQGWSILTTSVKRLDGSTRPPYHFQMYDLLRKECEH